MQYSYDKPSIIYKIKNYLAQYDKAIGKKNKILLTKYFVTYLIENKQFILDHSKFKDTVISKMIDITNEITLLFDDNNFNNPDDTQLLIECSTNINNLLSVLNYSINI
jgi:hypothetical protein